MPELDITYDERFYRSDDIVHGRKAKSFFKELTKNVFNQFYAYWEGTGKYESAVFFNEPMLYSSFAVAIDKITPVHVSEHPLRKGDYRKLENSRKIDFWCSKDKSNYYLELKKQYYSVDSAARVEFTAGCKESICGLVDQLRTLKKAKPHFYDYDDIYIGIIVFDGWHKGRASDCRCEKNITDEIANQFVGRSGMQLITANYNLPEGFDEDIEHSCDFMTIAGIVLTKKRV